MFPRKALRNLIALLCELWACGDFGTGHPAVMSWPNGAMQSDELQALPARGLTSQIRQKAQ